MYSYEIHYTIIHTHTRFTFTPYNLNLTTMAMGNVWDLGVCNWFFVLKNSSNCTLFCNHHPNTIIIIIHHGDEE